MQTAQHLKSQGQQLALMHAGDTWVEQALDLLRQYVATEALHGSFRFEQEANRLWASGRTHYSARTIGEYLRHNTLATDAGADFKVNDHIWPCLARLWTFLHPQRAGFFELRGFVVGVAA